MILYIENKFSCHYEIIESIILNYDKIINIQDDDIIIYLVIMNNESFKQYIKSKYPKIRFGVPKIYNYHITATIYNNNYDKLYKNSKKHFYIAHEITERLQDLSNVFFLTPLAKKYIIADKLPYIENNVNTNTNTNDINNKPVYIIQGNITQNRRYYKLLEKILDENYKYDFIIKIVGRGELPENLIKYSNKIVLKNNLNFIDYHKEFLNSYCIIPLITKKTHPLYYTTKLTSTINYCIGYKLKCLIDKDLQDIYHLNDVEIFNDENDISQAFTNTLVSFYN